MTLLDDKYQGETVTIDGLVLTRNPALDSCHDCFTDPSGTIYKVTRFELISREGLPEGCPPAASALEVIARHALQNGPIPPGGC